MPGLLEFCFFNDSLLPCRDNVEALAAQVLGDAFANSVRSSCDQRVRSGALEIGFPARWTEKIELDKSDECLELTGRPVLQAPR
jgi:hypothetical protein